MPQPGPKDTLNKTYRSWVRALRCCAWPIIALSVLTAVASVYYTFTHLNIDTSRNALVGSSKHLVKLSDNMSREFGGRDGLVVVVENGHPRETTRFAEALATELRRYPDRFPELFYRFDPEILKALGPALSGAERPPEDQEQPGGPTAAADPTGGRSRSDSPFTGG